MRSLISTILLIACVACSSGGGSSEGGIGGSGISQGAVTATGSATVAGTRWDLDTADVIVDGEMLPASEITIGMVVTVEGALAPDKRSGIADQIEFDDSIEGPISEIDPASSDPACPADLTPEFKCLLVLGQVVVLENGFTVFVGPGFDFTTVAPNDLVEVSGYSDGDGVIVATRIEWLGVLGGAPVAVELKGTVEDLMEADPDGPSFMIGSLLVRFDPTGVATDLSDMPQGEVDDGDFVEVEGLYDPITGEVAADRIELESAGIEGSVEDFEIEGIVSECVRTPTTICRFFRVGRQSVRATNLGIEFEPSNPFLVENGVRIEVEGRLVDGVLDADAIKLRGGDARIQAEIADIGDIDLFAQTVTLLGIRVFVDGGTRLKDERDDLIPFDLSNLSSGDFLEVRGVRITDGVRATELEREEGGDRDVKVRGRWEAFQAAPDNTVTILGLEIPTQPVPDTEYEGFPSAVMDEASFFQFLFANTDAVLEVTDEDEGDLDATELDAADAIELVEADDGS